MDFSARDLIDEIQQEEGTFDIPLNNGKKIIVRKVTNFRTIASFNKRAVAILKMAENEAAIPAAWRTYRPISSYVAEAMAKFTALVVAPKFTDLEVLELCAKNGPFAAWLLGQINTRMAEAVPYVEAEEIEEEKNASTETVSGETTSTPAGNGSVNTLTSGTKKIGVTHVSTSR